MGLLQGQSRLGGRRTVASVLVGVLFVLLCNTSTAATFKVFKKAHMEDGGVLTTSVDVIARNNAYGPITITLNVNERRNLKESKKYPSTQVVHKGEEVVLASFKIKDKLIKHNLDYKFSCKWGDYTANKKHGINYMLPFPEGSTAEVVQGFNGKLSHHGTYKYAVDFLMPVGTPITAARDGVIISIKDKHKVGGPSKAFKKYANVIQIMHEDGTVASYGHLEFQGRLVTVGERIEMGEILGFSGHTGFSTVPHLDFYVYKPVDGTKIMSLPIKFKTAQGIIRRPKVGDSYTSISVLK